MTDTPDIDEKRQRLAQLRDWAEEPLRAAAKQLENGKLDEALAKLDDIAATMRRIEALLKTAANR